MDGSTLFVVVTAELSSRIFSFLRGRDDEDVFGDLFSRNYLLFVFFALFLRENVPVAFKFEFRR